MNFLMFMFYNDSKTTSIRTWSSTVHEQETLLSTQSSVCTSLLLRLLNLNTNLLSVFSHHIHFFSLFRKTNSFTRSMRLLSLRFYYLPVHKNSIQFYRNFHRLVSCKIRFWHVFDPDIFLNIPYLMRKKPWDLLTL